MRSLISSTLTLLLLAALVIPDPSPAAPVPSGLTAAQRGKLRRQLTLRRKGKQTLLTRRLQPLGGPSACPATSVVTATDEFGAPIFPASLTPITSVSFAATFVTPRLIGPSPTAIRILATTEDPPLFTIATPGLSHLTMDIPGSGAIVGIAGSRLQACTIAPAACSQLHDFHVPVFDLVAALDRLDYPKHALDIKLLVEADDVDTLTAVLESRC